MSADASPANDSDNNNNNNNNDDHTANKFRLATTSGDLCDGRDSGASPTLEPSPQQSAGSVTARPQLSAADQRPDSGQVTGAGNMSTHTVIQCGGDEGAEDAAAGADGKSAQVCERLDAAVAAAAADEEATTKLLATGKKIHSTRVAINKQAQSFADAAEPNRSISPSAAKQSLVAQTNANNNNNNSFSNHNSNNHLNNNSNNNNSNHFVGARTTTLTSQPETTFAPATATATVTAATATPAATTTTTTTKRQHRLSFLQSLLLRKWPYLALAILAMSSLVFAIILSATTVYLMHGSVDCGSLALAAASASAPSPNGFLAPHDFVVQARPRPPPTGDGGVSSSFDSPLIELASGVGASVAAAPPPPPPADTSLAGRLMSSGGVAAASLTASNAAAAAAAAEQVANQTPIVAAVFERLPRALWPEHYELFIWPRIAEPFNFSGRVNIEIRCKEPTDNVTLHALDLSVDERSIRLARADDATAHTAATATAKATAPKITNVSQDKQLHHLVIKLDSELERGAVYSLSMDFAGFLNEDLSGFYKIKYEQQNSTELSWIAATQFQATDARRAFPCFDEPIYKATFSIKIKHWKNMTALSNMPIVGREDSADGLWVTDTFAKTHRMSTYLVAYAVTNFKSRSEGNISVWTRPSLTHTAEYALRIAGKILRYYEQFFGIEYPLPKMDMIALPDFNAGAMENWGLITYRESSMLYDEVSSSLSNKQRVAIVVAHELAHQWFGNLVTPKWWDDLWLNEGFASFVEYIGVDHVEPEWRMLDQFVTEEVQNVFKPDGLSSSHQISMPVNNPDEISEIFDHISYSKGASIIRMMSHFLTKDVFQLGLQRYLRSLKYNNAEQSDLWAYLTEAQRTITIAKQQSSSRNLSTSLSQNANGYTLNEEVNVERVMNTWTLQTGFPTVTVTRSYDGSRKVSLDQMRYKLYKSPPPPSAIVDLSMIANKTRAPTANQKWEIPLTYTWRSEQNWDSRTRLWMHQNDTGPVQLAADQAPKSNDEWLLVNLNQVGYYRVNYDQRNWQLLIDQLNEDHTKIQTPSRAQLLDDIFELAKSGDVEYKLAMESTRYLKKERELIPWSAAVSALNYIDGMLKRTGLYGDWQDYIRELITPYYARYKDVDWTMDGRNTTTLFGANNLLETNNHNLAISWACQVEKHCIDKAKRLYEEYKQTGVNRISPGLRYNCYCTAIENGERSDWEFLWKRYEKEQSANERDRILRALACSKEPWMLSRYLEWIFDKTKPIRRQDGPFVFRHVAFNNNGRELAFNFIREKWQLFKDHYGRTSFSMGQLIKAISVSMNTQTELNQLVAFFESIKNDLGNGRRAFQNAIEEADGNIHWRNRNYKILEDWIKSEMKKPSN